MRPGVGYRCRCRFSGRARTHAHNFDDEWGVCCTCETREEAIATGAECIGGLFMTARLFEEQVRFEAPSAERMLEDLAEGLYDEYHEAVIERLNDAAHPHLADLQARLRRAFDEWTEEHKVFAIAYSAEDQEQHDADDVAELAAAAVPFKVGDLVDYHARIGGPVTLANAAIADGPFELPSTPGARTWKLKGKAGVVAEESLSPAAEAGR